MDPASKDQCKVCHLPVTPTEGWGRQEVCSYACFKRGVQLGLVKEVR